MLRRASGASPERTSGAYSGCRNGFREREVEEGKVLNRLRRRQPVLDPSYDERLATLERQVRHLEELLEGLQDAVHRESVRRDHEAAEFQRQISPAELARALSEDARRRGLE